MSFGSVIMNTVSLHIGLGETYSLAKSFAYRMAAISLSRMQIHLCQYHQRQSSSSSIKYRLIRRNTREYKIQFEIQWLE